MKRILMLLLALALLTGCAAGKVPEAEQTEPVAEFTRPSSLYVPDSTVEQQTAGAVKVYTPQENCIGIAALDGKVVLVTDLSRLILMDSETGELGTAIKVGERISVQTPDFTASREGITYYREEGRELVFLSSALQQKATAEIPEGITGSPCVSRAKQEVYYSKDNKIWGQDLQTGEIRPVFDQACQKIEPVAGYLDAAILSCTFVDDHGAESLLYLDTATGEVLPADQILALQANDDRYLVRRKDGITEQLIYGTVGGENRSVHLEEPVSGAFSLQGGYRYALADTALEVDSYDFTTDAHSAHIRLEGVSEVICVASDSKYLWILAKEGSTQQLYRWDVALSMSDDAEPYLQPLYTRENPDVQGLEQCAQRAQALADQYGIYVDMESGVTGGYELTEEYQVPAINRMLDEAEAVLAKFPEGFLQESLSEGSIHIRFVRAISGDREVVQFYENGDAYIVVAATENIRLNLLRGLAYVIDSHVLGGSRAYDDWKDLNPAGFDYDYSYYFYTEHEDSEYLTEENRAFADAYAMTFPYEDRCLLFAYAMMEDSGAFFATDIMQAKLATICEGIRDAYEWYGDTLPWEQYLAQ